MTNDTNLLIVVELFNVLGSCNKKNRLNAKKLENYISVKSKTKNIISDKNQRTETNLNAWTGVSRQFDEKSQSMVDTDGRIEILIFYFDCVIEDCRKAVCNFCGIEGHAYYMCKEKKCFSCGSKQKQFTNKCLNCFLSNKMKSNNSYDHNSRLCTKDPEVFFLNINQYKY